MFSNKFAVALATLGLIVAYCTNGSYAYPPSYSDEPPAIIDSGGNDKDGGGYLMPQFNLHYSQLQQNHNKHPNHKLQQKQQQLKYPDQKPFITYFTTSQTSSTSTSTSPGTLQSSSTLSSLQSKLSSSNAISTTKPSLQSTYVYKADVPTHIQPETNKVINAVKLATATKSSAATGIQTTSSLSSPYTNNASINLSSDTEQDGDLSKKIIGSR